MGPHSASTHHTAHALLLLQVEAWGERAHTLAQQVKAGALLSVLGHLGLDMRRQESSPSHGPALTVGLDSWELVTPATVPSHRAACAYKGEWLGSD